ncbi:MAG: hypothetical protein MK081_10815 [Flavobacteriales bacterium]|nr:hypothetical protein [Flavobacteriales bacterium]
MNWLGILLLIIALPASERQGDELNWEKDRRLSWEDFRTRTGPSQLYKAFSYTGMRYVVDAPDGRNISIEVTPYFVHSKSWVHHRHKIDRLLAHEQGHFDLTAIYAFKLDSILEDYEVSIGEFMENRMIGRVEFLFDSVYAELQVMQDRYDAETNHSIIEGKQEEWEAYIADQIETLP